MLGFAVFEASLIVPAEDIWYNGMDDTFLKRAGQLYMLLVYPIDSLFGIYMDIESIKMTAGGLAATMIGGALVLAVLFVTAKRNRKLAIFAVPYFLFLTVGTFKYLYWNHLGISTFYLLFVMWIIMDDDPQVSEIFKTIRGKIDSKATVRLGKAALAAMAAMPLGWTLFCSGMDIAIPYGLREVAEYIEDNGLEGHDIMMTWKFSYKGGNSLMDEWYYDADNRVNMTTQQGDGATLTPYFDTNIFYNFNITHHGDMYMLYRKDTDETNERNFALWREYGYPEYMFCKCPLNSVFPELKYKDIDEMYELEASFERSVIYKFSVVTDYLQIYHIKEEYRGKGKAT